MLWQHLQYYRHLTHTHVCPTHMYSMCLCGVEYVWVWVCIIILVSTETGPLCACAGQSTDTGWKAQVAWSTVSLWEHILVTTHLWQMTDMLFWVWNNDCRAIISILKTVMSDITEAWWILRNDWMKWQREIFPKQDITLYISWGYKQQAWRKWEMGEELVLS